MADQHRCARRVRCQQRRQRDEARRHVVERRRASRRPPPGTAVLRGDGHVPRRGQGARQRAHVRPVVRRAPEPAVEHHHDRCGQPRRQPYVDDVVRERAVGEGQVRAAGRDG